MVKQHKKKHENDEEIDAGRADINMKLKHFCSVFFYQNGKRKTYIENHRNRRRRRQ